MAEESMKDFEQEINDSFKTAKKVESEDNGKWDRFAELIETKEQFDVKIIEVVKGGCIAYLEDTRAFIPASQLSTSYVEKLEDFQGKHIKVVVITADPEKKRLVLSHRAIEQAEKDAAKAERLAQIKVGDVLDGKVETIKDYGDGKDVIVFEDLDSAESEGKPIEVVVFLVDPARLTALMQLAAFSKTTPGPAAIMPYGHACQQIYAIPRAEGESDDPHAVVGMTDMYARRFIAKDLLSFAVPYKLYKRMDSDLDESFLTTGKFRLNMDKCI